MTQQERLKKIFEENSEIDYQSDIEQQMSVDTFIRVASELLEEREKCQCGLTLNVTVCVYKKWRILKPKFSVQYYT